MTTTEKTILPAETIPERDIKNIVMHSGTIVYFANDLQPIGEDAIFIDGQEQKVDIVGTILVRKHFANDPKAEEKEIIITKNPDDPDSPLSIHKIVRKDTLKIADKSSIVPADKPHSYSFGGNRKITINPSDKHHRGWFSIRAQADMGIELTVSEASHPVVEHWHQRESKAKFRRRIKQFGAVGLGLMAFKGTTMPGGVYDSVMDGSQNAHEFVLKEVDTHHQELNDFKSGKSENVTYDGIQIKRKEAIDMYSEGYKAELYAAKRVAQTMGDLDHHEFSKIIDRAKKFEQIPGIGIRSDKEIAEYQKRIDKTDDLKDTFAVMSEFLKLYYAEASYGGDKSLKELSGENKSNIRHACKEIIEVMGKLPAKIGRYAFGNEEEAGSIEFGGKKIDGVSAFGTTAAYNSSDSIVILTTLRAFGVPLANFKQIFAHELAHDLPSDSINDSSEQPKYGKVVTRVQNLASHLLGKPEFTSDYAASEAEEEAAESGADVLIGEIANPDDVLEYTSRANKSRLKVLIDLELELPGITDYLYYRLRPELLK